MEKTFLAAQSQEAEALMALNGEEGLRLTWGQAIELVHVREESLKKAGRVEFGEGALGKIVVAFRDSPCLMQDDYLETLSGLTELFYEAKNETQDLMTDDELIEAMREAFDGVCQGSLELLAGRELFRWTRGGADDE